MTNGGLEAMTTDQGRIDCDRAVICAGIWSKALTEAAGDRVFLASERGYHGVIAFLPPARGFRSLRVQVFQILEWPHVHDVRTGRSRKILRPIWASSANGTASDRRLYEEASTGVALSAAEIFSTRPKTTAVIAADRPIMSCAGSWDRRYECLNSMPEQPACNV
ncbi:hypothetical protein FXV83_04255 [Bradyrhizobium hipponense]|uniref:FAD dependent oxidoreductase domain-containing protein n=1 Tax=Bradyrhizobium hipponense TaxID=2605638 RepID=A0A5S4YUD9_9BRAD|nr:hypothetical protein [Bradyrhizobium hipponense]TYO67986.1 hypothetical protein FXV83_04255 [Bradyrhizobium hipponense]